MRPPVARFFPRPRRHSFVCGPRAGLAVPQIRVEGVIADVQQAAGLPLVAPASFEDEPRIAAGPCAHRVAGRQRGREHLAILSPHLRWQVVQVDAIGPRERHDAFDQALERTLPGPSACSDLPRRPRTPVAVRSSIPNNSASRSVSTTAAQFTATNGPFRRRPISWIWRATSSLPVPLSPASDR